MENSIRYDPKDKSHIWVYGEAGELVCKAGLLGLHPTEEETKEVISKRQNVKKRLKRDLKDKQAVGEEFIKKTNIDSVKKKNSDKEQPKLRLRRHFHERE